MCSRSGASIWHSMLSLVCSASKEDDILKAQHMLSKSVQEVETMEKSALTELQNIQRQVKSRTAISSKKTAEIKDLLVSSVRQRRKLNMLTKKRVALTQHIETLQSSSLNQQVIASVKQTSTVLKQLGLDEQIESVDSIMMDLNESMQDTQNIQQSLSNSLDVNESEEQYLQRELELLLNEDCHSENVAVVCAPQNTNIMNAKQAKSSGTAKQTEPDTVHDATIKSSTNAIKSEEKMLTE